MRNSYFILFTLLIFVGLSFFVSAFYDVSSVNDLDSNVLGVHDTLDSSVDINNIQKVIRGERVLRETGGNNDLDRNVLGENEFSGYIVEFEEKPIKVRESELKEELKENNEYIEESSPLNPFRLYAQIFTVTDQSQVQKKVQQQRNKVDSEHSRVKNRIFSELNQQRSITGNAISSSDYEEMVTNEFKEIFNGVALNIGAEEAKEIEKIDGVKRVQPNYMVKTLLQDSLPLIGATEVWKQNSAGGICTGEDCLTGKGVKIAIIDTGVDYTHPDFGECASADFLQGNCKVIGGYDFVNNDEDPMDDHGHGTHVAGTAAGKGDYNGNNIYESQLGEIWGVAPDAQILAYKVLDSIGYGDVSRTIASIERAVLDGADIISMSLGGYGTPDDASSIAVDNAVNSGVSVIVAAGNSGPGGNSHCQSSADGSINSICSPGAARNAITVGAMNKQTVIAPFSSRGPVIWGNITGIFYLTKPDITAPGVNICAAQFDRYQENRACVDGNHIAISGTSMANPIVSGAVALLKQKNPNWSPDEIKNILKSTSSFIEGSLKEKGAGFINISSASSLERPLTLIAHLQPPSLAELTALFPLDLYGTAEGESFTHYEVFYQTLSSTFYSPPIKVCEGFERVSNNVLCSDFIIPEMKEGIGVLSLYVYDSALNKVSAETYFDISFILFTHPKNFEIHALNQTYFEIQGKIPASTKNDYILSYTILPEQTDTFDQPTSSYGNTGVILTPELIDENGEGTIARIDMNNLQPGFYNFKITLTGSNYSEVVNAVYFDSSIQQYWPITSTGFGMIKEVADLDNDKKAEIITFTQALVPFQDRNSIQYNLSVYNLNGNILWQKALTSLGVNGLETVISSNGNIFIYYITKNLQELLPIGYLVGLDSNGELLSQDYPIAFERENNVPFALHAVDLDNDGEEEIVAFAEYFDISDRSRFHILIFNQDGSLQESFNIPECNDQIGCVDFHYANMVYSLAFGNFDQDADLEIVVPYSNRLFVYNGGGTPVSGWPKMISGALLYHGPSVADIDADGSDDIIVGTCALNENGNQILSGGVFALDRNANLLNGWPSVGGPCFASSPAISDIDNNGNLEIILSDGNSLFVFNNTGSTLFGWPVSMLEYTSRGWSYRGFALTSDLNNDQSLDVLYNYGVRDINIFTRPNGRFGGVHAITKNGVFLDMNPDLFKGDSFLSDQNPKIYILDANDDGNLDLVSSTNNYVYIRDLKIGTDKLNASWTYPQHDPQHTGCYNCQSQEDIICTEDKDCDDLNDDTVDSCINPGTIESYCRNDDGSGKTCTDSDGFDITTLGNVNYDGTIYNDQCLSEKEIIEYTCASTGWFSGEKEVKENNKECQYSCVEGKCVDQDKAVQRVCSDNDVDNKLELFGSVLFKGSEYKDLCVESGLSVNQYFCVDDKLRNFVKRCANGMRCISGSCQYIPVVENK